MRIHPPRGYAFRSAGPLGLAVTLEHPRHAPPYPGRRDHPERAPRHPRRGLRYVIPRSHRLLHHLPPVPQHAPALPGDRRGQRPLWTAPWRVATTLQRRRRGGPEWGIIDAVWRHSGQRLLAASVRLRPPVWRALRPHRPAAVVLVSLTGLALSYVLWLFAGNFALLVAARFIGGIMSANIATASAIVADVTTPKTRSKGMALIGVAFGVGFILGPALGGITSMIDLTQHFPALVPWGINRALEDVIGVDF
ncbi:MAG: MFS transporter, partial [Candidatus Competibacteraceae bacterium]|nr:MFS transporter [Candidatus Competibacteraceae bacterium]